VRRFLDKAQSRKKSKIWLDFIISITSLGLVHLVGFVLLYDCHRLLLNAGVTILIASTVIRKRPLTERMFGTGQGREYSGLTSILFESARIVVVYDLSFLLSATVGIQLEYVSS
jgi:hypothetical protein